MQCIEPAQQCQPVNQENLNEIYNICTIETFYIS
jgi:hypothetical protein